MGLNYERFGKDYEQDEFINLLKIIHKVSQFKELSEGDKLKTYETLKTQDKFHLIFELPWLSQYKALSIKSFKNIISQEIDSIWWEPRAEVIQREIIPGLETEIKQVEDEFISAFDTEEFNSIKAKYTPQEEVKEFNINRRAQKMISKMQEEQEEENELKTQELIRHKLGLDKKEQIQMIKQKELQEQKAIEKN